MSKLIVLYIVYSISQFYRGNRSGGFSWS